MPQWDLGRPVHVLEPCGMPGALSLEHRLLPHARKPTMSTSHILVVDDNAAIRELVAMVLVADGHDVNTANDGAEALRLLEGPPPYDLIVSDLKMPSLDGPSLYLEVSRRWPGGRPHLLFMSGFVDSPEYAGFLQATKVPVLLKPFDVDHLSHIVSGILQQP